MYMSQPNSVRGFFDFFFNFFELFFKKLKYQRVSSMPRVKVNVLYSIWSLYLLFLFNLVPIFVNINQFGPSLN